jgi:hypothetical protein
MARAFVEFSGEEQGESSGLIYVLLGEAHAWTFNFTSPRETFQELLPEFEKVIQTFEALQ